VEYEISPEPTPEEREAIDEALKKLLSRPPLPAPYLSAWRKAGIEPEDQAAARPRSSWGASRA
jgi:hypothetical protein